MKAIVLMIILLAFLVGCDQRKELTLQGGYEVVRVYGNAHSIMKPTGRELVMPNVVNVADDELYIIGLREASNPKIKIPSGFEDQPYGYFVYDKKEDSLLLGLSKSEFRKILKSKSISLNLE